MTATSAPPARRPRRPRHPMRTIFAEVAGVRRIAPRFVRVTFTGDDLPGFVTPFPDQFVTLLLPQPHQESPVITPDFTWEEYAAMPEDVRPIYRNYTVRRWRPDLGEMDVDIVLHDAPGFGSTWAEGARPGMRVGMWGPRVGYNPPPDVAWQLLAGDETALPAVGAILEALPSGARASVILEVHDADDELPLPTAGDVDITWLHRGEAPAGTTTTLLDAVRAAEFPAERAYAWAAAELDTTQAIGKHLRRDRGLKTAAISAIGYWRREPV